MPRYIAKLADNKYVEWSTIVDAPVTYILTRDQMLAHLDEQDGKRSFDENRQRLERCDKNGTSCQFPMNMKDLIRYNRAGEDEKEISLKEILERYDIKHAEENSEHE